MEQGSLRCDANISVRRKGENKFGPKTELKNLNSFRFLEQALWYELNRQEECLIKGERIEQDTRLWDERQKITIPIRTKEETKDYRYFPEPDLGPLEIEQEWIKKVAESLPELPNERRERLIKEYGLPLYDATLLTAHKEVADFFERCVKTLSQPKLASNFIMTEVLKEVKFEGLRAYFPIAPEEISELLALMERGIISGNIAKQVFCEMKATKTRAKEIIEKKKLLQINDDSEIERVCKKVLSKYPGEVSRYQKGKKRVLDFFVGQVMKETQKRANPKKTRDILLRLLG
jgi:aspartyl-tRNA(Asn)/glutamyl-tRNA(Gln) amidotransferase subunit B